MALGVFPRGGCRVVCYCKDCQAFARFLARPGITDQWGGTDLFQMAPSRVRITEGANELACVRLSPRGMYRWYCGRCQTPVGNSNGPRIPFIGVIHAFMDHASQGHSRDDLLGQPIGYVWTKSALAGLPAPRRDSSPVRLIGRSVKLLAKWWLTGARSPSPLFDAKSHVPRTDPRILTPAERRAL